jgi:hypothetical protein
MRSALRRHVERRIPFEGRIKSFTSNDGHENVLLRNVFNPETGEYLCDHCWVHYSQAIRKLGARYNDILRGTAVVEFYIRGTGEPDYGLCSLAHLRIETDDRDYIHREARLKRSKQKSRVAATPKDKPPKTKVNHRSRRKLYDFAVYCEE